MLLREDAALGELGRKMEYAMAAVVDLAAHYDPERPVKVDEISGRTGAPPRYVGQLLARLKAYGLTTSTQGPAGGYMLMRPPDMISLAEVHTALREEDGRRDSRFELEPAHRRVLDAVSEEIAGARRQVLRDHTLADLAGRLEPEAT